MWSGTPRACTACELVQRGSRCARGCGAERARLPRLYGEPSPLLSSILRTNSRYHLPRYPVNTGLVSDAGLPRVASVRPALPEVGRHEARGFVGLFECCWHQALRPRVEGEVLRFLPGVA